ncbi:MAG: hypothetical protein Q8R53_01635 [Nanoarchaeota archaeon]|nr:hypothetical protein [Nanoarchaeota archaeon]
MNIGGQHLDNELIAQLITDIRQKKELRSLSREFVQEQLLLFLEREPKMLHFLLQNPSSRAERYKQIVKELRKRLRRAYGLFRWDEELHKRQQLVEELVMKKPQNWKKLVGQVLATHASTQERLSFFEHLYRQIFAITGKPKRIIDLGCGLHPYAIPFMKLKTLEYFAYDLSEEELQTLEQFFAFLHTKNPQFQGHAAILDLFHWQKLKHLKNADVCFLFKMTDVLDRGKGHKVTEAVLREVSARFVVVSFPTKTMSGKRMNYPKRKWMELLCNRLGYPFTVLQFPDEVFYVIEKKMVS